MIVTVAGVLLLTRTIGPLQYGLYASGLGVVTFLFTLGTLGLDVYLLRKTGDPEEREFDQAFTLLLLISSVLCVGVISLRHIVASFLKMPEEAALLGPLAVGIPLYLLALPAVVRLDRDLNFKRVALNELFSQISYYVVALPLAFRGFGAWAPVVGFVTQQGSLLVLSYRSTSSIPRLYWDRSLVKKMLGYGTSYSTSLWVYQLRELVNPAIVGRFVGAEAVGYVAIALRIGTFLSFARTATWRIAIPALAKLSGDAARLRNAISEGIRFEAIAVGIPLASFALLAPLLIPLGLGSQWTLAGRVFPFVALGYLSNAMFSLNSSVLYLMGKNWQVTLFHALHVALLASGAFILVPRIGFVGYGWAEGVAILSYFVIYMLVEKELGPVSYGPGALWFGVGCLMLILSTVDAPARYIGFGLPLVPLVAQQERRNLMGYVYLLLSRGEARA